MTAACYNVTVEFHHTCSKPLLEHYIDVKMGAMASQITGVSIVFTQSFVQPHIKENITVPSHRGFIRWFPTRIASNAENVSISWRHLGMKEPNKTNRPTPAISLSCGVIDHHWIHLASWRIYQPSTQTSYTDALTKAQFDRFKYGIVKNQLKYMRYIISEQTFRVLPYIVHFQYLAVIFPPGLG